MAGRLQGRRCFVTAAGQGIGRAAALAYAAEGASVVATDRDAGKLAGLEAEGIETRALDVLDDAAVAAALAAAGPLDVLFNCAGFVHQNTVESCTDGDWDFAFALNVRAMWQTIRAALPGMLGKGGGAIVNMASACSSVKGAPNRFLYGTTKAAVIGLTKSVATDYVARGIRCNAVCPGMVMTPIIEMQVADQAKVTGLSPEDVVKEVFLQNQPIRRPVTAEEIAGAVVFLCSPAGSGVTGTTLAVDGGYIAR